MMGNYSNKFLAYVLPLLMVCTFVLAVLLGLAVSKLEALFAEVALLGILFLLLVFWRVEFALLGLLAMGATLFYNYDLPHFFGFSAVELGVYVLVGLVLVQGLAAPNKKRFVQTPLDWPILFFIGFSLVSLFNGMYNLGTVLAFRNEQIRTLLMYLVFFMVTNLIRTRRQLMTLVGGMFIIGTVIACLMIAQQVVGSAFNILPEGTMGTAEALGQELYGAERILLPGSAVVFIMLCPAVILRTAPGFRKITQRLLLVPVVSFPLAILFTFTRGLWIGAIVSLSLFLVIARSHTKNVILLVVMLVVLTSFSIPFLTAYLPRTEAVLGAIQGRFSSLFAGEKLVQDSSTQWRLKENDLAIAKFKQYPFLGIGPSAEYRAPWDSGDHLMYYIHNSYLFLLIDCGIIGFVPFLVFSIVFVIRGLLYWTKLHDPVLKSLTLGFMLSYIAVLICSISSPRLMEMQYVILISIILGVNEVAIRLDQQTKKVTEIRTFPTARAWS